MAQHLPQELIDHVLHFLSPGSLSLRSCSLVSCSWANPAQRLLFRHLRIQAKGDNLAQRGVLQDFIDSRQVLSTCIQILPLYGGRYFKRGQFTLDGGLELNGALLTNLLSMLPRLKELHLQSIIVLLYDGDSSKVAVNEKALKVLSFKDVQIVGESEYSSLLQRLQPISSVDSLHVEKITSKYDNAGLPATLAALSCLDLPSHLGVKVLTMKDHRAASVLFIKAFTEFSPNPIETLYLEMSTRSYQQILPILQNTLKAIGPSLHEVTLHIGGEFGTSIVH